MNKLVNYFKYAKGVGVFMMVSLLVVACSQLDVEPNKPDDNLRVLALEAISGGPIVDPVVFSDGPGGNATCAEAWERFLGEQPDPDDENLIIGSSGRQNTEDEDRKLTNDEFSDLFSDPIEVTTDGTFVSWSITPPSGYCVKYVAVIVKGGNSANVYFYEGVDGDSGLASPVNASGDPAELSNLTVCYVLEKCDDDKCFEFEGETAWSAGSRYVTRGNWATYTEYDGEKTVNLYAGQTNLAGTVSFSAAEDGFVTITIDLAEGWDFAEVMENVKIQDYATAPSRNPAPGRFDHKTKGTGSTVSIVVPENNFYGVHVDVGQWVEVECEDEELAE